MANRILRLWLLPLICCSLLVDQTQANYLLGKAQIEQFHAAVAAIQKENIPDFTNYSRKLKKTPLYPYLRYLQLKQNLDQLDGRTLQRFRKKYAHAFVSKKLHSKWLLQLAENEKWDTYLRYYDPATASRTQQCHYLRAMRKQGRKDPNLDATWQEIWESKKSLPGACFVELQFRLEHKQLGSADLWPRINRLLARGRFRVVQEKLQIHLPPSQQIWVERFIQMHRNPLPVLSAIDFPLSDPQAQRLLLHGIKRYARQDLVDASILWNQLRKKHQLSPSLTLEGMQAIGMVAAYRHHPLAAFWLENSALNDAESAIWRIYSALRQSSWEQAFQGISYLNADTQAENRWRYWRARTLAELGHTQLARSYFRKLADQRDYYSFLAADILQIPYQMNDQTLTLTKSLLAAVSESQAMRVALAHYQVDDSANARRQWSWALSLMNDQEIEAAATLANHQGLHDRAIISMAAITSWDDLAIRFPTAHQSKIVDLGRKVNLDPAWIYGIIRQESAFIKDARSGSGALGLMQLMPATAREVARKVGLPYRNKRSILQIDNNLALGSYYLREVYETHAKSPLLATASYNAGPNRVTRWLPKSGSMAPDIWAETIPFDETRKYVRRVLTYASIYDYRMGREVKRLNERMPLVRARL